MQNSSTALNCGPSRYAPSVILAVQKLCQCVLEILQCGGQSGQERFSWFRHQDRAKYAIKKPSIPAGTLADLFLLHMTFLERSRSKTYSPELMPKMKPERRCRLSRRGLLTPSRNARTH